MPTREENISDELDKPNSGLTTSLRILLAIAAISVTIPVMHEYRSLINSVVLALIIVMTMSPIMHWMRTRGVPNGLAYLLTMLVTLVLTIVLGFAALTGGVKMIEVLNQYSTSMSDAFNALEGRLVAAGLDVQSIMNVTEPQRILQIISNLLGAVFEGVSFLALIAVIIIFMLGEALTFSDKLSAQLDLNNPFFPQVYSFAQTIRRYVTITASTGAVSGLIVWLVLALLGIQSAALWGLLYFITSFIPNVGFWLALIPPLIIAGLQYGTGMAAIVLLFYMVFSAIINQGVRPTYMGHGLDLSPLWVILSLVIWSTILGLPGIIIGVPLTVMVKELLLETSEDTQWLAGLMGSGKRLKQDNDAQSAAEIE